MKSFLLIVMLLCCIPAYGQVAWNNPADTATTVEQTDAANDLMARPGLSIRHRRAMGITIRNLRLKLSEMEAAGTLEGMTRAEISVAVLDQLIDDNPQAFARGDVDWDSILAFIEKLIPIILKMIALFGAS